MKRIFSSLLIAVWAWALALAAIPALHEWAHGPEAGHEDHQCVVKMLVTGGCDAPETAPCLTMRPMVSVVARLADFGALVPSVFLVSGPWEHGPPGAAA